MSFIDALGDYHAGRLMAARQRLVDLDGIDAKILLILVDARLERPADAISLAQHLWNRVDVAVEDRVRVGTLLMFLLTRIGNVPAAASYIVTMKQMIREIEIVSVDVESELWLSEAVVLFAQDRLEDSERVAWHAVYADLDLRWRPSPTIVSVSPITTTKARALALIGMIRATQERYHEQYRFLREAVAILRTAPSQDLYLISFLQANRSFYARDFGMLNEIIELELISSESWPDDFVELRVEVSRSLAHLYALNGDEELALAAFRQAASHARSATNKLLLTSDEAFFSRQLASPCILKSKLIESCELADKIDWESVGMERYALHALAQELAYVDPVRAGEYMLRYEGLQSETSPLSISGRRGRAEAAYAGGLIAIAGGRRNDGVASLLTAYEVWRDVGFRWRAAAAAIELANHTGSASFASYAAREAQQYPKSWLARRVSHFGQRAS